MMFLSVVVIFLPCALELSVLQEAIDYGTAKGIFVAPQKPKGQGDSVRSPADIARMAKTEPDTVARVLKSWLET